jgi:hypothetical protein
MTKKQFFFLVLFFITWRIALLAVSGFATTLLPYHPTFPYYDSLLPKYGLPQWLYSWANFDGVHYLSVAEHGYIGIGLVQAFFPFLPYILLHLPWLLTNGHLNTLVLGLSITNVCAFLLAAVWFVFVKEKRGERFAWVSLMCLLGFPTAFYFGALYTESLFLLFTILAFWLAEKKHWLLAGLATLVAASTRLVGIFLIPALLLELWFSWRENRKRKKGIRFFEELKLFIQQEWQHILSIGIGSIGLLLFMGFLYHEFHDPLYFAHVQSSFGAGRQAKLIFYPQVVYRSFMILMTARPYDWKYFAYAQEFLAGTLGLIGILLAMRVKKVRPSYSLFAIAAFLLPTFTGTFSSMARYILVCFPLYFLLTNFVQKRHIFSVLLLSISIILLIINTVLFIQGYWVA